MSYKALRVTMSIVVEFQEQHWMEIDTYPLDNLQVIKYRGTVSMGSMGSAEPINFQSRDLETINF